mmetsp:Transcript_54826/g.119619  ORF Transcript_54826/g.119619 Transcript_54826/m.119619 type:complete len:251 (-) Transcript_54826:917-1669(-)
MLGAQAACLKAARRRFSFSNRCWFATHHLAASRSLMIAESKRTHCGSEVLVAALRPMSRLTPFSLLSMSLTRYSAEMRPSNSSDSATRRTLLFGNIGHTSRALPASESLISICCAARSYCDFKFSTVSCSRATCFCAAASFSRTASFSKLVCSSRCTSCSRMLSLCVRSISAWMRASASSWSLTPTSASFCSSAALRSTLIADSTWEYLAVDLRIVFLSGTSSFASFSTARSRSLSSFASFCASQFFSRS